MYEYNVPGYQNLGHVKHNNSIFFDINNNLNMIIADGETLFKTKISSETQLDIYKRLNLLNMGFLDEGHACIYFNQNSLGDDWKMFYRTVYSGDNNIEQFVIQRNNNNIWDDVIVCEKSDGIVNIPNNLIINNINVSEEFDIIQAQLTNIGGYLPILDAQKADKSNTYTKNQIDEFLLGKASLEYENVCLTTKSDKIDVYTKLEIDNK